MIILTKSKVAGDPGARQEDQGGGRVLSWPKSGGGFVGGRALGPSRGRPRGPGGEFFRGSAGGLGAGGLAGGGVGCERVSADLLADRGGLLHENNTSCNKKIIEKTCLHLSSVWNRTYR